MAHHLRRSSRQKNAEGGNSENAEKVGENQLYQHDIWVCKVRLSKYRRNAMPNPGSHSVG
jgi:hypothetical protein